MASVTTGVVRVWHRDEGWGVVDAEEVPGGCRVDVSVIDMSGSRELRAGQEVLLEFEPAERDGYAFRATRVQVLDDEHLGA